MLYCVRDIGKFEIVTCSCAEEWERIKSDTSIVAKFTSLVDAWELKTVLESMHDKGESYDEAN